MRVFCIGTIDCPLRNIPHVSASDDEATTFLSFWQMVRMGAFSFGWSVSLVGGILLRNKWTDMGIHDLGRTMLEALVLPCSIISLAWYRMTKLEYVAA